jgi:hypothetical protein
MGWHIFSRYGTEIVWHNGGTAGYRSFAGFAPGKKKGVVVLVNTSFDSDDLGRHVLESKWPAAKFSPPKERVAITLDPAILATYVGDYQLAPDVILKVTTEDKRLFAQPGGQGRAELFAEKEGEFFVKIVDAQISFVKGDDGKITHLILHQGGANQKAPKVK